MWLGFYPMFAAVQPILYSFRRFRSVTGQNPKMELMQHNEFITSFIPQAREEIEEEAELNPREVALLRRLVAAIDSGNDARLVTTVAQLKAEVDALSWPIPTILPTLVDMLMDKLTGNRTQVQCPTCGGLIPIIPMDHRIAARYTCPGCGNDVVLSDEEPN